MTGLANLQGVVQETEGGVINRPLNERWEIHPMTKTKIGFSLASGGSLKKVSDCELAKLLIRKSQREGTTVHGKSFRPRCLCGWWYTRDKMKPKGGGQRGER